MGIPVLTTKLYVPRPRARSIPRPTLIAKLNAGLREKLTLISAPAGFGKSTLVSQWLAETAVPVAWVSLDALDGELPVFLTYLVAALQTVHPRIGTGLLDVLESPQLPPVETLLTVLLNDLANLPAQMVLVLDDYHVLESPEIDTALAFLIDHLPPLVHLVIITREDPQLPLARLRARGEMIELRAADLRFSMDEVAAFFNQLMGLELSADDIYLLGERTEGWVAGLQLAALSLQGVENRDQFIQSFAGTHHFVLDYLVEEVLNRQTPGLQRFLLQTSILERLCGALCDAVTCDEGLPGQETLETIYQANLFLLPMDGERRWYRYHHLFAEFLRQRLHLRATVAEINALHIRASEWYAARGFEVEAFQHAAQAGDIDRAQRLITGKGVPLYFRGAARPVLRWLASLPQSALDARPALWVTYASALTVTGQQINSVEEKLQAAEAALSDAEMDQHTRDLIGHIATIRAMLAGPRYDVETMQAQARRALKYLSEDNSPVRTMAMWVMGLACQYRGERAQAKQYYAQAVSISQASGNIMVTIAALTCLGQMQEAENQLFLARQSYQRVLELVGDPPWPTACEAYLGLGRLYYQWDDLTQAEEHARQGDALGRQIENVDTPVACGVLRARVRIAQGDLEGAAAMLAATEQFAREHNFLNQMPLVVAENVRVLLLQGNVSAAARLADEHGLPVSQARVALARQDYGAALATLATVRQQVEVKQWLDDRLQVLVLEALACAGQGDRELARARLDEALAMAAPGGFIRVFVDEGPLMATLLSDAVGRGVLPSYTGRLVAAFPGQTAHQQAVAQPLVEPLSERELEILRLLAAGLSNRQISERLFLALSTVKGHNRNIYAKLQVQRRTEAIARARELGLL